MKKILLAVIIMLLSCNVATCREVPLKEVLLKDVKELDYIFSTDNLPEIYTFSKEIKERKWKVRLYPVFDEDIIPCGFRLMFTFYI